MKGKITTDKGTMVVEFYEKDAPNTVNNFVKLAKEGFYKDLNFHRVIPGYVAQGGCPNGTGAGGPGYTIKECYLWHMREEILVVHNFLFVMVDKIHNI